MITLKIMKHGPNQHGWGVSVMKYGPLGTLVGGFVLNTFETKAERDEYAEGFQRTTGFPWDDEL